MRANPQFVTADGIFPERDDVGVAEEYSRTQALADHPFDDGGRAWGAAAMQQDALLREVAAIRRFWTEFLFMNIPVRHFIANLTIFLVFTFAVRTFNANFNGTKNRHHDRKGREIHFGGEICGRDRGLRVPDRQGRHGKNNIP